jgi:hypothetical protein
MDGSVCADLHIRAAWKKRGKSQTSRSLVRVLENCRVRLTPNVYIPIRTITIKTPASNRVEDVRRMLVCIFVFAQQPSTKEKKASETHTHKHKRMSSYVAKGNAYYTQHTSSIVPAPSSVLVVQMLGSPAQLQCHIWHKRTRFSRNFLPRNANAQL